MLILEMQRIWIASKRKKRSTWRVQLEKMSSTVISYQTKETKISKGTNSKNKKCSWSRSKASQKEKEK